jgi:hypothetical protein
MFAHLNGAIVSENVIGFCSCRLAYGIWKGQQKVQLSIGNSRVYDYTVYLLYLLPSAIHISLVTNSTCVD